MASKILPLQKGGSGKSCNHTEGGEHRKFWGSFNAVPLSFGHTEGRGEKFSITFEGGGSAKGSTLSQEGVRARIVLD